MTPSQLDRPTLRNIARIAYEADIAATDTPEDYYDFDDPCHDDPAFDQDAYYRLEEDAVHDTLDLIKAFGVATPEQIHAMSVARLTAQGWKRGEVTDYATKEHRALCSWAELHAQGHDDARDYRILVAVVKAYLKGRV